MCVVFVRGVIPVVQHLAENEVLKEWVNGW